MPTDKPRVTITVEKDVLSQIEEYRFQNHCKNQTQAILSLVEAGLDSLTAEKSSDKPSPAPSGLDLDRLMSAVSQMNEEGRERVIEYAEDLAASGHYTKNPSAQLVQKKA